MLYPKKGDSACEYLLSVSGSIPRITFTILQISFTIHDNCFILRFRIMIWACEKKGCGGLGVKVSEVRGSGVQG